MLSLSKHAAGFFSSLLVLGIWILGAPLRRIILPVQGAAAIVRVVPSFGASRESGDKARQPQFLFGTRQAFRGSPTAPVDS